MVRAAKPNELILTREYDAPVELVWSAWTDPEQAAKWWGPRGFTLTTHSKELRPGGIWHYTMHGPDGTDYINKALYHVVEEHRRLVYDHGGNDERAPLFRVSVEFIPVGQRTRMEMIMTVESEEAARNMKGFIKQAGGNATWDRLAEYLAENHQHKSRFVINRSFDVPADVLFDAWTQPTQLVSWIPPTGFSMQILRGEIQSGQTIFFVMKNTEGYAFHAQFHYQEISTPTRIVYTQQFCDAEENLAAPDFGPHWPQTLLTTVEFTPEGERQTRVTVTSEPVGAVTEPELTAFLNERTGMTKGWTGSFDVLETLLPEFQSLSASMK